MKKILMTTAICLAAISVNAQCKHKGYEVKAENSYTNYCVRQASNPRDAKRATTHSVCVTSISLRKSWHQVK